ncbi:DNA-binding MarR family transcriptional regulator [Murinocardiopsis flavida]|uniref:DNA-binding MarR family transcriptional regulator n=1 Tax=Murinocardiopsis flavida TaxID=645275 RepID=A0A2P8CSZ4_9ACTN|nr:MarR family transcriptional regulator [Murinocardiopsis flavida]PSK88095.1 DNA-binding MarR family transcriptional regulator [Murinocardiopsis flavida]
MSENAQETRIADALIQVTRLVERVFAEVGRHCELTPQQAQLLCLLTDGPIGMTDLSRLLNLEKSSLTGLVDRVERRGLVARHRDTCDRRAWHVALTEEGQRAGAETHDLVNARLEALAEDLPASDRDQVAAALVHLLAAHRRTTAD